MRAREPGHHEGASHLSRVLAEWARRTPHAPALLMPGEPTVSYRELNALVRAGTARLATWGVGRDDRVVVPATNDLDGAVTLLSVLCAAVCCPVDPRLAQDELEAVFDVLEPAALVLRPGGPSGPRRAAGTSDVTVLSHDGRLTGGAPGQRLPDDREVPRPAAGESILLLTPGATPAGRIVPITMSCLLDAARATVHAHRLTPADRRLNLDPLFRVEGLVRGLVTSLMAGASMICVPDTEPGHALALLDELAPTWFAGCPMTFRTLLDRAAGRPIDAPRLRFVRSGAAPMPDALRLEVEEAFGVPLAEAYGMSEAPQIACEPLPGGRSALGMRPTGTELGVLGPDGRIRTGPGARGELVVRGPGVIDRYLWPADANSAFVHGWLRTGDLGAIGTDGSMTVTGRAADLIHPDGGHVSPTEVEDVLLRHPGVGLAVVFGVADGGTERVAAAVVPRPGHRIDEPALRAFAARRLAPFAVPERVLVRNGLPPGAAGQPVRAELPSLLGVAFDNLPPGRPRLSAVRPPAVPPAPAPTTTPRRTVVPGPWPHGTTGARPRTRRKNA